MLTEFDSGVALFINGYLAECARSVAVKRTDERVTFTVRSLKPVEQTPDTLYPVKAGDEAIVKATFLMSGQTIEANCTCESITVVDEIGAKNRTYVEAVLSTEPGSRAEWR